MKRRRALQSLLGIPAAAALPAPAAAQEQPAPPPSETPNTPVSTPDAAGQGVPRFFTAAQFSALRRLAEIIMPRAGQTPGAGETGAAEFLDSLVSQSPADRVQLYGEGLDRLNAEAQQRFGKPFAQVSGGEAQPILKPLTESWTYQGPSDPFARFLRAVKDDVISATASSREYTAAVSGGRRGASGVNIYWFPIE